MKQEDAALQITPDTKVGALLDQHPELEEVLIKLSPAFAKLRNPVLRKTVAKIATLQQVARIGDVPLATIINKLREAAGIKDKPWSSEENSRTSENKPEWVVTGRIVKTLDARPIIESGGHPLGQVMNDIKDLKGGEIYELITPFLPAPLLDMAKSKGFESWSYSPETDIHKNYIRQL